MASRQRPRSTPPIGRPTQRPFTAPGEPAPRRWRRLTLLLVVGLVVAAAGALTSVTLRNNRPSAQPAETAAAVAAPIVRDSSHRLSTAPDGKVTFVEFLDFECEGCKAVYPVIEQLRTQYEGRVTFVIRYFPLDSHFNAVRAARAVEAAAQQGQLETMYQKMYDTQTSWGEQQTPADDTFAGFATDLGLDMTRWTTDYNSPATLERVEVDRADGTALGLQGTPAFFLNGQQIQPESVDDLTKAIDDALAR